MVSPKKGEELDLSVPPSKSPDRQEVITIIGETRQGHAQKILTIERSADGKFIGFGQRPEMQAQDATIKGRFSQFLSPNVPDEEARELAKQVMERIGIQREREQAEKRERGLGRGYG
jgi:hypothetical protein